MTTDTKTRIVAYLKSKKQAAPVDLMDYLGIGQRAVFKQLSQLRKKGVVDRLGKSPKVFYFLKEEKKLQEDVKIPARALKVINENYFLVSAGGEKFSGINGFRYWCGRHNLPIVKTANEYAKTYKKYAVYKKAGLINGMYKMKTTFNKVWADKLYYLDFYSIERFGKTKLGWMLLYAKQSQNRILMEDLGEVVKKKIRSVIEKLKIDAVGFVPPTVRREAQLMSELERILKLNLPKVKIVKAQTSLTVPQKTLNQLADRIENAQKTIVVSDNRRFKRVLLIDDAVGSGATINETARKMKERGIAKKIYGLAITGSFKGFEVISEV